MSCMKEEVLREASIDPYSMISCSDTVKVGVTTMLYILLNECLYLKGFLFTGMYYTVGPVFIAVIQFLRVCEFQYSSQ